MVNNITCNTESKRLVISLKCVEQRISVSVRVRVLARLVLSGSCWRSRGLLGWLLKVMIVGQDLHTDMEEVEGWSGSQLTLERKSI